MERDLGALDELLSAEDLDGYLLRADGDAADQRYLSGFPGPDPFLTLYANDRIHLLVRGLDRGLARNESRAETVASGADYDQRELIEEHGRAEADRRVVARFLTDHDVASVAVPTDFPIGTADGLRENDVTVRADEEDTIRSIRATKTADEIDHIDEAQRATEAAMARAELMLRSASVDGDALVYESEPLTSERIKEEIEVTLLRHRCVTEETIVAGGTDAANPHDRGSGPLSPNEPIVIDIFPRHRDSKYHADMTRTFCVGEPTDAARNYYELTREALRTAIDRLEPGITGAAVHDSVCDVYEEAGIRTTRTDESAATGFIHGTGHGVGLEVHELPRLSTGGGPLKAGHVVTVEPGVYDPVFGGIRIEDLVVITPTGCRNLTEYETEFVI